MNELIVDAHHHIWRRADLPWLKGEMQPRIFGEYQSIMRDYPVEEYLSDVSPHGVVKSVYVQANWKAGEGLVEAQWVQAVSDHHGFPHGIVAHVDLADENIEAELSALAALPAVRGIRQQLHWHENQLYRFAAKPDIMNEVQWRHGFALLERHRLLFELQIFASQMADGAKLAQAYPGVTLVLEHAGMLEDRSEQGWRKWRAGMKLLACQPNVLVKLSGLGTFLRKVNPAQMRPVVHETLELFGPARCMFGSNFPIEKIWCNYAELIDGFLACIEHLGPIERRQVLSQTALKAYRLG